MARYGTRILVGETVNYQLDRDEKPLVYAAFRGPVRSAIAIPMAVVVVLAAVGLVLLNRWLWPAYFSGRGWAFWIMAGAAGSARGTTDGNRSKEIVR